MYIWLKYHFFYNYSNKTSRNRLTYVSNMLLVFLNDNEIAFIKTHTKIIYNYMVLFFEQIIIWFIKIQLDNNWWPYRKWGSVCAVHKHSTCSMSQTRKSKAKVYTMHVRFVVAEGTNQRASSIESSSFYEFFFWKFILIIRFTVVHI